MTFRGYNSLRYSLKGLSMDDEKLHTYLKAIGMGCFVTYYSKFANTTISRADLIELLHTREGYTEKLWEPHQ